MNGKYVIVRGDRSGVFAGTLESYEGREVTLTNCRRLWYWDGAASLSQMAVDGVSKPRTCKFSVTVPEMTVLGVIELIPCSEKATRSILEVATWRV